MPTTITPAPAAHARTDEPHAAPMHPTIASPRAMPSPRLVTILLAAPLACAAPGADPCPACSPPTSPGQLADPELTETSGVAASQRHEDVLYAHNDSGDSSRFFALSREGAALGTFKVKAAQNVDWEDLAVGPCGAGSCIYLADTGDNDLTRLAYTIYRVVEPEQVDGSQQSLDSERFEFTYPDGPHDAEALLIHPRTGVLTIVTKVAKGPAGIYELSPPFTADMTLTAVKRGELQPPEGDNKFTGGALHPDVTGLLLRTDTDLFYYPMTPDQSAAEALTGPGCPLPVAAETHGEAVTWLPDSAGILTIGEGLHSAINVTTCDP